MSIVYNAAVVSSLLGIPAECSESVLQAEGDEIVVYYGGWDLEQLCSSVAGKKGMSQELSCYDKKYGWSKPATGYYRLLLPVPFSNCKTWSEQLAHLQTIDKMWKPAPFCVAATAVLARLMATGGYDLLKKQCCRCAELRGIDHAGIGISDPRLYVSYIGCYSNWDIDSNGGMWLAAARKC